MMAIGAILQAPPTAHPTRWGTQENLNMPKGGANKGKGRGITLNDRLLARSHDMIELDIVERLRGKVRVPVNDGAGLLNGKDFFERSFPTSKAAMEAADEIERLRAKLASAPAADVIERVAKGQYADPATDNLTVPLAIELSEAEARLTSARKALEGCRTAHCGYAITKDEQYPTVLESFWKELQRIDGIARAALKDLP